MTRQSIAEQPKTSNLSHQPLSVCAKRKLTGFAEFAQICGTTPTRNRDANGNRTSKTTPWGTVAYSYDAENRLVESGELGKSESVKYTYDANGNRTSKTTPWGTVKYAYDKENRLVESGDLGKSESVRYTYDRNGNLLSEIAGRYQKDYVYNAQNRMAFSEVLDRAENTRNLTEYRYDAFGRRIETIEYLGDHTRNLYDGFSFDIAEKTVLQTHAAATMPEQKYRAGGAGANSSHPEPGSGSASTGRSGAGVANGTRYRYIGDEPLENAGSAGAGNAGANAGTTAAAKTRSRPNSEYVLYAQGEPVAVNADGDTSYFGTDILGSVRSVTDKYGNVKASYEYDAFGTPYLSNIDSGMSFGYTGKIFDSNTGLYDYGFRDYSPNSARFTTVDPVRDGSNWFSYVVNDPINYIDPFGLTSTDAGNGSKNSLWINNGDGTYTATKDATLWGLQQETGVDLHLFEGYDGSPNNMPIGTTVTVPKPAGSPAAAVDTGSAIAVTAPSNNGSNNVSTNTTNGGSFGSAPIGGGAGNVAMGGGSSGSSFASVGMNGGGQNTTAQANTPTEAVAQAATPSVNIDWGKEVLDCFSEIKLGLTDKFSLSVPDIIEVGIEIDLVSNNWTNNKDGSFEPHMTSGIKLFIQLGSDYCPIFSYAVNYGKDSPVNGDIFRLFSTDYEFTTEIDINEDVEITLPIPIVNINFNMSEFKDLLIKLGFFDKN